MPSRVSARGAGVSTANGLIRAGGLHDANLGDVDLADSILRLLRLYMVAGRRPSWADCCSMHGHRVAGNNAWSADRH